ncbi:hypothetical protein DUNSADRAFT_10155 [Dunaliella salina]|uniref:Encoded protein n=1 Tax=Dunaliella salina TaxID=3046 RepID=A0ABQ7GG13_DUNSA|nr:hypothetical protein DUNSADRAFT_10155 [Dunaliella salina]|eukprot:KAF5833542.1 hypothetical protein DUNSADRAFT_10155 [Dunaliella salina]
MDSQADLFVENLAFAGLRSEAIGNGNHKTSLHLAGIDRQDSGWGVKGIDVQFVPSSPLRDSDILLDQKDPSSSSDNAVALGVGIGVGVGGGLLLIGIVTALAMVYKRRKRTKPSASSGPYSYEEISIVVQTNVGENGSANPKSKASDLSGNSSRCTGSTPHIIAKAPLSAKGSLALGHPLNEIELPGSDSVQLQKLQEDQSLKDPNALVRREVRAGGHCFCSHSHKHFIHSYHDAVFPGKGPIKR